MDTKIIKIVTLKNSNVPFNYFPIALAKEFNTNLQLFDPIHLSNNIDTRIELANILQQKFNKNFDPQTGTYIFEEHSKQQNSYSFLKTKVPCFKWQYKIVQVNINQPWQIQQINESDGFSEEAYYLQKDSCYNDFYPIQRI